LETLANEIGVRIYRGKGQDPVKIAQEGIQDAIDHLRDVVIIDTAGRLHVDEEMMAEAEAIKAATKPDQILMVVDAMTGQDVVNVAAAFAERVDFDGVIMSKMDGDARGGGALSIKEVTGKPIKFISSGEKPDSLEAFHPDRMAKRILGMGDVISLIETASRMEIDDIEETATDRMMRGDINLNDFVEMRRQVNKVGGIRKLVSALPGGDKAMSEGNVNEKALDELVVIIGSMTKEEREKPGILNGSRKARIAAGAGVEVWQVNQLLKKYNETRKMMKKMLASQNQPANAKGKKGKKGKRRRGFPGMGGLSGMPGMGGMGGVDMRKMEELLKDIDK
jgi:signal recognition particle subunit SRP54